MPLRDIGLFLGFAVIAPAILLHPYIGALLWVVFGLLNPHRLTFGPAYNFPFAMIIVVLTFVGLVLSRDQRQLKGGAPAIVLLILMAWMCLTTLFALTPPAAVEMWVRVMKIFLMTFVLMYVLHTKRHVDLLIAAIVFSVAFYGVKGGVWTILTGGGGMVMGPEGSVMEGNNALGVANVMIIPLLAHIYQQHANRWLRYFIIACMLFIAAAVLGSYSRGAVLALAAMGALLWWRSSHRGAVFALLVVIALVLVPLMPAQWEQRMQTIQTYEQDGSAMSRLWAWQTAWNIATDNFFGAGFEYPSPQITARYSPGPFDSVAHSIYFQVLGEHGFIGLALFLLFWSLVWRECARTRRLARDRPELQWAFSLMSMSQATLVGFAVGGAFLNLAFWDMPYYLYAAIIVTGFVVRASVSSAHVADASGARPSDGLAIEVPKRTLSSV